MRKLARLDLYSLEQYADARAEFRAQVIAHKKNRLVVLGPHASLQFEDRLTMQYQVQEMLRIERIFEKRGIDEELSAYNPLIPDGNNWKATFMIEYENVDERRAALAALKGIEKVVWVQVDAFERVYAIANEDLERENEEKTSAVHFLRFELSASMIAAVKAGADIGVGVDHPKYRQELAPLSLTTRDSLVNDLD